MRLVPALKSRYWQLFFLDKTKILMSRFYRLYGDIHVAPFHVTVCSFRCLPAVHSCQRLKMGFNNNRSYWHIFWFTTVSLFIIWENWKVPTQTWFVFCLFYIFSSSSIFVFWHLGIIHKPRELLRVERGLTKGPFYYISII